MNAQKYRNSVLLLTLSLALAGNVFADGRSSEEDAAGTFACGPKLFCDGSTQYCAVSTGGPVGIPPAQHDYRCADLPSDCPSPATCECMTNISIGCECTESDGNITVTCKAP